MGMIRRIISAVYQNIIIFVRRMHLEEFEKFYPVRKLHGFVLSSLTPEAVVVRGHRMFLGPRDDLRISIFGVHEPNETALVERVIKKGSVVLDIGAHIGYYTLIFAKLVGEEGKVFAFEPDPENFALLQKNIEANEYSNVFLVRKAVANQTGALTLYRSKDNSGDHRIYDSLDGRSYIKVDATRLDDYFQDKPGNIDFIKMDVQGAELEAIRGMASLLQRAKTVKMLIEFWPIGLARFGGTPETFLNLLLEHRFKLYWVNEKKKEIEPVDIVKLLVQVTPKKENFVNLFCVKGDYDSFM